MVDIRVSESPHNVAVIVGTRDYTVDSMEAKKGEVQCWLYEHCWFIIEMSIRGRIGVKKMGLTRSEIITMDTEGIASDVCTDGWKGYSTVSFHQNFDFFS